MRVSMAPRPGPSKAYTAFQERLRKAVEVREHLSLWVKGDTPPFTPALLPHRFGDGRALFAISTLNQRPRYWVIQGDSGWTVGSEPGESEISEHVDDILSALEDHFGNAACSYSGNNLLQPKCVRKLCCKCEDCLNGKFRASWPMVYANGGCSWSRLAWPDGFATEAKPGYREGAILAANAVVPRN